MFCKNCGEENPENAVYCRNCGAKLVEDVKKTTVIETEIPSQKRESTYTTTDNTDNSIACIQKFVEQLRELISLPQKEKCDAFPFLQAEEGEKDDDLKIVVVKNGFGLVEF